MINQNLSIGNKVTVQTINWHAKIIKEISEDIVYVTSPDGLGRDVPKCNIRNELFGHIPQKWIENQKVLIVVNWPIGTIRNVYAKSCHVEFDQHGFDKDFLFNNLKIIS